MRKKYKRMLKVLIFLIGVVLILMVAYRFLKKDNDEAIIKVLDSINNYNYTLDERDSSLMKDTYNELKKTLKEKEIDYEEYAKLLAKLFVIDLFTMNNKVNKYDVGSLEYVYPSAQENFQINVEDTIYKTIENNSNGKRRQELPVVKSVNITSIDEATYTINEVELESFIINLTWNYEKNLGYDNKATITVVKENNKLYVVSYKVGDVSE